VPHDPDDGHLPEVTDDMLRQALATTRPFTVVVLKAGPGFEPPGPDRSPAVAGIVLAHGRRNYALHLAGLLPVVCPVADGSALTGIGVFDATPEEVDRIMAGDPGVQAGVFTYDIHPSWSFPGSTLPEEADRLEEAP
jgi:hypothetical protein